MTITNFDKAGLFNRDMCYVNLTKKDLPFSGPDGETMIQPLRFQEDGKNKERFLVELFEGTPKLDKVEIIQVLWRDLKSRYGDNCVVVFRVEVANESNELRKVSWSDNVYLDIKKV